jgi:hypothetical protein
MNDVFINSHEKSQTGRGQNNDQGPSSTTKKVLPEIPDVAPPNVDAAIVSARGDGVAHTQDQLSFRVKGSDVPAHAGMRSRSGGEGGTITPKTDHKG